MKDRENKLSGLKYKLVTKRKEGKKFIIWTLRSEQKEYVENLGYFIEEYLYRIFCKKEVFRTFKDSPSIIKKVRREERANKQYFIQPLKSSEKKILDEYNIKYEVYKYKIYL